MDIPTFGYILLMLYVDNMLIAIESKSEIVKLKRLLSSKFSMKDLGPSQHILGMDIHRNWHQKRLWMMQDDYASKIL